MRRLLIVIALLGLSAVPPLHRAVAEPASRGSCPAGTDVENTTIARAWHEDTINRRNPRILREILATEVVHHAAGGYPKKMDEAGIAAMMGDFLSAFPDLVYTFDQFIAKDNFVVERYTATGTQQGTLGYIPPTGRVAAWTGINIFRIECGRILEIWSEVDAVTRRQQLMASAPAASGR
jgi:predicted ester cyclase